MAMERWRSFGTVDRWEPFRNLVDIQGEVNRLFDSFAGRPMAGAPAAGRPWLPAVDMHETKDELVLLTIKGERRWDDQSKDQTLLHVERVYGQFERLIQLPMAVQADKVKAAYRDGLLEIKLPKAEELKPREIKIEIL